MRQYQKNRKSMQENVDELFYVLAGYSTGASELTPAQKLIVDLNNKCANIFRVGGQVWNASVHFICGESDPNQQSRGESAHYED